MKFSFVAILLLATYALSAQSQLLIMAGPQATTSEYKISGTDQATDMKFGFMAGVGLKVPFEDKLFFAPAAYYSMKGYKVTFNRFAYPPDVDAKDNNTTLHTFELALLLQYDFKSTPGHFYIKAGPSLDFQLFGNEKYNLNPTGSVDRKMKFGYGDYGQYSASLQGHLGYETKTGITIAAFYTHGLANISNTDGGPSIKHRTYSIGFGKLLTKK